jgi:hypothetical protein
MDFTLSPPKFMDSGVRDWKKNPGSSANRYHAMFSRELGYNSLYDLQNARVVGPGLRESIFPDRSPLDSQGLFWTPTPVSGMSGPEPVAWPEALPHGKFRKTLRHFENDNCKHCSAVVSSGTKNKTRHLKTSHGFEQLTTGAY